MKTAGVSCIPKFGLMVFWDTLVDSEDDRADNLVVGLFVKRARGEEAAKERQAESRGEETEAEEETNSEPGVYIVKLAEVPLFETK